MAAHPMSTPPPLIVDLERVASLGPVRAAETVEAREPGARPRQLVGQPASQGIASGPCRVVGGLDDIGRFRAGEVLVCDAIQPMMTHLVPLAVAVVERRGGMLIHGAIIARELGIPCVNGVRDAARLLTRHRGHGRWLPGHRHRGRGRVRPGVRRRTADSKPIRQEAMVFRGRRMSGVAHRLCALPEIVHILVRQRSHGGHKVATCGW